jgi:uncharacterized SAM-binding protein YcdF (DUF218 family)
VRRVVVVWLVLGFVAAVAVGYAGRRPLLTAIGGFLIVRDPPAPAGAIVVLAGSLPDRILEAVDLYQAQLAPRIILTREAALPGIDVLRARGGSLPEPYEENVRIAQQLGVPAVAISVLPEPVGSTLEEEQELVRYLRGQRIESILLVTSKAHTRRARLTFRTLAAGALRIAVCPSPYDPFEADNWWKRRGLVRRVVTEYGKLVYFVLVDRWRARV